MTKYIVGSNRIFLGLLKKYNMHNCYGKEVQADTMLLIRNSCQSQVVVGKLSVNLIVESVQATAPLPVGASIICDSDSQALKTYIYFV